MVAGRNAGERSILTFKHSHQLIIHIGVNVVTSFAFY